MNFQSLSISGAWVGESQINKDNRGFFREWFKTDEIELATGYSFNVKQANVSQSKRGVLRGIHYSLSLLGQVKWVTCVSGSIWDVVVDLRPNSPTYGTWDCVELTGENGKSILISEGLGHGFVSLADESLVAYLQTSNYSPSDEYEINPHDSDLAILWPLKDLLLAVKDSVAPTLAERQAEGQLPILLE